MLNAIDEVPALSAIARRSCAENDIAVDICDSLLTNGDLNDELIRILKVDEHYSTKNFAAPPKAIDCLIVVKCNSGEFELTLVELRNVSSTRGVRPQEIMEKFRSTFV